MGRATEIVRHTVLSHANGLHGCGRISAASDEAGNPVCDDRCNGRYIPICQCGHRIIPGATYAGIHDHDVRVAAGRYEAGVSLIDTRSETTEENSSAQAKADLLGQ